MLKENRFEIIHLFDLLAMAGGEELFKDIANSFHSVNKDVNQFIKEKAIRNSCNFIDCYDMMVLKN